VIVFLLLAKPFYNALMITVTPSQRVPNPEERDQELAVVLAVLPTLFELVGGLS